MKRYRSVYEVAEVQLVESLKSVIRNIEGSTGLQIVPTQTPSIGNHDYQRVDFRTVSSGEALSNFRVKELGEFGDVIREGEDYRVKRY